MRQPGFAHLTGRDMWRHCDHDHTALAPDPARVVLAPLPSVEAARTDPAPWRAVRGAAAAIPCPPDLCADAAVVLADPLHGLFALTPEGWHALPPPRPKFSAPPEGALDFQPVPVPHTPVPPAGIARDKAGRVWLLDRTPPRLRVLAPDFTLMDTLGLPPGVTPDQMAASSWCVAVSEGPKLLVQPFGGNWRTVALDAPPIAIAADANEQAIAILLPGPRLGILCPGGLKIHPLPKMTAPLFLLVTGPDTILVGEPRGAPGAAVETGFLQYTLDATDAATAGGGFAVRSFDGRALWRDAAGIHASTAAGARLLYPRTPPLRTEGAVETFWLDSTIFACAWHRVFVDVCLPPGTTVTLDSKTADDLPPYELRRPAQPPENVPTPPVLPAIDDPWPRFLSGARDEPGWWPLGILDTRGAMADIPDPPERVALPSDDPLAAARGHAIAPWPRVTLEGLIKAPPGRYLALRIRLTGSERLSPEIFAVRASFQRPSLLEHLPAYWRADPAAADSTDRALALFEGFVTETDARITALRQLADPRLVPPEALDWLASFVALTFDRRIGEPVRRQLLMEASWLYERRGTVPGLTRLLSILAEAPATIVETFRLRRQAAVFLGTPDAIVGPGLQLGDLEAGSATADRADTTLLTNHAALMLRRRMVVVAGGAPCPPDDPPWPMETDPLALFVRRFAHRFTVVLPCHRSDTLEVVLQDAIEANKPAHTLHTLCWLDAGFRLGKSSLVGLARLGDTLCFEPGVLGTAVLGTLNTVGEYERDARFRPGQRLPRHHRSILERTAGP